MREDRLELRAFRGTRRSSVYRSHAVAGPAAARIREAAAELSLGLLASLGACELDKAEAHTLAAELTRLRASATLLELDDEVTALAAVANWCARASGSAWLRVS